ncbi:hypothetical protein E4U24_008097 [Claviceps purpurea]|nr:hypothetical protein E4U28_005623 [Claviceps purpurea]KAG6161633.1 hypothetical protein E4U11_003292 [Claviceps purpurea]KAG6253709.1 hypothetical protein E4U24_008097 [Claviceps purpurea]
MEETPTEQPGRIGTLPYFPMNAQESAKSRMVVATPRDTTIPEDHHNSIDHTPQVMDIRHPRIPRFPRTISSISPTAKAMKIRGFGDMVGGTVVVPEDRSIRGMATAIRDFAEHSWGSMARCQ